MFKPFVPPIRYEEAKEQAIDILTQMTFDEKISMIVGHKMFFTKGLKRFNVPSMYMSDASQGVNIRRNLDDQLEKSVAFPSSIALASTWNKNANELDTCNRCRDRSSDDDVLSIDQENDE